MPERKDIKKVKPLKEGDPKYDLLKSLKKQKFELDVTKGDMKDLWDILDKNVLKLKERSGKVKCAKLKAFADTLQGKLDIAYAICEAIPNPPSVDLQAGCKMKSVGLRKAVTAAKLKTTVCNTGLTIWSKFLYYFAASVKYLAYYGVKAA